MIKERFNYKLNWINFILAFCIVIVYVINYSPRINSNANVEIILNSIKYIANVGVSCFFGISGFLFYYKFNYNKVVDKLKRRFFTLIIPFIVWNTIIYIFYLIISRINIFEMEVLTFTIKNYSIAIFNSTYSPL